ncbi:condensin complex subunit 2-like [Penaeus japonicus]|uniref:condensin complex subunit 2-like n=2 Tax=Penaeus japonicus TaxID=27405 RepID=UPI001C715CD4|nr:condensin complex subunit 2-like [Penaeus japonicus]XP_042893060.1 condensin complex subunit 2-like [Penaeus japonicus]XP_042893061.1 condensin complex subunit 2-like [Penaeus japonicus]
MSANKRRSSVGFALSPSKRRSNFGQASSDTPHSRRHSIMDSMGSDNVFMDVPANNDEQEKKERQLSRLQQQMQSRNFSSPSATPGDRRKSLSSVAGLTNQQLSDHYSKCIQLSAENKISMKNAFNLQLIDYMSEMLRRKDSDMNNFQVASCTLDASTKIYAYRVDSIHTDTLKMAGGLGRTQDKEKNRDDEDDTAGEEGPDGEKKKRKIKKKAVIETNIKNLNVTQFDLEFEVDPLFKKTSAQFDEGRSGSGQFLSTLQLLDDSCQMVLDSETILMDMLRDKVPEKTELVLIPKPEDLSQRLICPTFAPFEFTSWKVGDEDSFCDVSRLKDKEEEDDQDAHRFDVNAVPEPLDDDPYFDADDTEGIDHITGVDDDENGTVMTIGQEGCQRAPPPLMEAVHLKEHLATNPSEYSYFDSRVMSAWAGPGHWRIKALSKVRNMKSQSEDGKKKKKEFVSLVYEEQEDPEITKLFAVTRKATKLTQTTFKLWSRDKTTLPVDLHYDGRSFTKLFGRPAIIIRRQQKAAEVDDSVQEYDYDNQNDRDNYCADVDDGASGYGDHTAGYDMTDLFSQTVMGSQPATGEDPDNKGMHFLDNLVAAPNRVAKINIGYARTAKKVDMKKLKSTIWNLLADPSTNKENEKGSENHVQPDAQQDKMDPNYKIDFTRMYKDLPAKLSSKMTENLSVPLAFIALLHLANEHSLKLDSDGNMKDFTILQG